MNEFVSVVRLYYQEELDKKYERDMANYCAMLPAFAYSDKKPDAPKYQDYKLITPEDEEKLKQMEKLKEALSQSLIQSL